MVKNIFISFVLTTALCFSLAQTDTNRVDSKGRKQGLWKKYDGTTLLYEGRFVNDVPTGEFVYYHKNGKLKSRCTFLGGTSKVKTVLFDENGKKAAEGLFIDQQKEGVWTYFNEKGMKIKVESYKKGVKHGLWQTYSSQSGILLEEKNYDNGELDGVVREFFTNGDIQSRIAYIKDKRNGLAETFYSDSILCSQGNYHNNVPVGTWDYYDGDGKLRKTMEYSREGKLMNTLLCLYNGSAQQKVNMDFIAYFLKQGNKTKVVMRSGNAYISTDDYDYIKTLLSLDDFCPVTPKLTAANSAIMGYEKVNNETILVKIVPPLDEDVFSEGNEMHFVKMLFDKSPIKEE